jgi:hypothetical protein
MTLIPHALPGMLVTPTHIASTNPHGVLCVNTVSTKTYLCVGKGAIFEKIISSICYRDISIFFWKVRLVNLG